MAIKTVEWSSNSRLSCAGCAIANVILCLEEGLVAPRTCPTVPNALPQVTPNESFELRTLKATLTNYVQVKNNCGGSYYRYVFSYEDTLLVPATVLTSASIKGVVCEGCITQYIDDSVGNEIKLTNVGDVYTLTTQHGCEYTFSTSGGGGGSEDLGLFINQILPVTTSCNETVEFRNADNTIVYTLVETDKRKVTQVAHGLGAIGDIVPVRTGPLAGQFQLATYANANDVASFVARIFDADTFFLLDSGFHIVQSHGYSVGFLYSGTVGGTFVESSTLTTSDYLQNVFTPQTVDCLYINLEEAQIPCPDCCDKQTLIGHGFIPGDIIAPSGGSGWIKAVSTTAGAVIVLSVEDADNFTVGLSGCITGMAGVFRGVSYAVVATSQLPGVLAGSIVNRNFLADTDVVLPVGNSPATGCLLVNMSPAPLCACTTATPAPLVSVVKNTQGAANRLIGDVITSTVTVQNNGTASFVNYSLVDNIPAAPVGTTRTYTSVSGGGATGNTPSGTGNISNTLTLPVGSTVTYTINDTVNAAGSYTNSAVPNGGTPVSGITVSVAATLGFPLILRETFEGTTPGTCGLDQGADVNYTGSVNNGTGGGVLSYGSSQPGNCSAIASAACATLTGNGTWVDDRFPSADNIRYETTFGVFNITAPAGNVGGLIRETNGTGSAVGMNIEIVSLHGGIVLQLNNVGGSMFDYINSGVPMVADVWYKVVVDFKNSSGIGVSDGEYTWTLFQMNGALSGAAPTASTSTLFTYSVTNIITHSGAQAPIGFDFVRLAGTSFVDQGVGGCINPAIPWGAKVFESAVYDIT